MVIVMILESWNVCRLEIMRGTCLVYCQPIVTKKKNGSDDDDGFSYTDYGTSQTCLPSVAEAELDPLGKV